MTDFLDNFSNAQIKLSNDQDEKPSPQKSSSLLNTLKGYIKLNPNDLDNNNTNENDSLKITTQSTLKNEDEGMLSKIKNIFQVEQSYTRFLICLFVGICLMFLSLMFLPMVIFSPQKFVLMFSMGSFITIYSFIFYYGTNEFMNMIFCHERRIYTISFILSLFVGFYFTFNPTYYIIALLCSGLQMIVMVIYVLSFIPGGKNGISFILSMMVLPIKKLFGIE